VPVAKNAQVPRRAGKLVALLRGGEYFPKVTATDFGGNLYMLLHLSEAVEYRDQSKNRRKKDLLKV